MAVMPELWQADKACNRCGEVKPDTEEFFRRYCKSGDLTWQKKRKVICRVCESKYSRKWNLSHPDAARTHLQNRKNKPDFKIKQRERNLKKSWGLSSREYSELLLAQGSRCAICFSLDPSDASGGRDKHFHVDHCHATGKIRGLLCGRCNKAVGLVKDSVETALQMALYLERNRDE